MVTAPEGLFQGIQLGGPADEMLHHPGQMESNLSLRGGVCGCWRKRVVVIQGDVGMLALDHPLYERLEPGLIFGPAMRLVPCRIRARRPSPSGRLPLATLPGHHW